MLKNRRFLTTGLFSTAIMGAGFQFLKNRSPKDAKKGALQKDPLSITPLEPSVKNNVFKSNVSQTFLKNGDNKMNESDVKHLKFVGGCLCDETTFEANEEPFNPHLCSCSMCQKSSGAPTVAWTEFPLDKFKWTGKEPKSYRSSEKTQRLSCGNCGGLLGTLNDGYPNVCITIASLDNPNAITPIPGKHSYPEGQPKWWNLTITPSASLDDSQSTIVSHTPISST